MYITLYQILLYAPFVLDLTFPQSYSSVMSTFNLLGVNFAEDSGMTCVWQMDYVDQLLVQTLLPFVLAAAVVVTYCLHMAYHRSQPSVSESANDAIATTEKYVYLRSLYSQIFLTLTYLLLPSTVTSIFRMFPCQNVDPDSDSSEGSDNYMRVGCKCVIYLFTNPKLYVHIYPLHPYRPTIASSVHRTDIISA